MRPSYGMRFTYISHPPEHSIEVCFMYSIFAKCRMQSDKGNLVLSFELMVKTWIEGKYMKSRIYSLKIDAAVRLNSRYCRTIYCECEFVSVVQPAVSSSELLAIFCEEKLR